MVLGLSFPSVNWETRLIDLTFLPTPNSLCIKSRILCTFWLVLSCDVKIGSGFLITYGQLNVFGFNQNMQLWLNLIANYRYIHWKKICSVSDIIHLTKYYARWNYVSSIAQPSKIQDKSSIFLKGPSSFSNSHSHLFSLILNRFYH